MKYTLEVNESKRTVMELVHELEKALPAGEMVIVGNGKELTAEQKAWLHSLTDCEGDYNGGYDDGYTDGHDEGYDEGYYDALNEHDECEDCDKYSDAMRRIVEILDEVGAID